MSLNFMTADDLAKKTAKGTITTIYGMPDAGKSTFMVTVAEKMKVLFIDSEGKFGKICNNVPNFDKFKQNIAGIEVKTLKELISVVQDKDIEQFDAVVIDSVTQLVDKELHDIMFVQRRRRSFDDYNDLGTNFMGAIEILKSKGISTFFTIQAKEGNNGYEPDVQGGLVAKKAIEASDWMFFIEEGDKGHTLSIKGNLDARLKKKGISDEFPDQLTGEDVKFSSLWDIFPSKGVKEDKANIEKENINNFIIRFQEIKTGNEIVEIWKEVGILKLNENKDIIKAKNDAKKKFDKQVTSYVRDFNKAADAEVGMHIWNEVKSFKINKLPEIVDAKNRLKYRLDKPEQDDK